jgi:hypothetical protein
MAVYVVPTHVGVVEAALQLVHDGVGVVVGCSGIETFVLLHLL